MFAAAREAAGTGRQEVHALTVGAVVAEACSRYGDGFARVAAVSQVWVNGDPAGRDRRLSAGDEVAILPPVSGGA
ncbi:MAG: MoaD/ThiS family protein [Acidimicrobiales bacterium]